MKRLPAMFILLAIFCTLLSASPSLAQQAHAWKLKEAFHLPKWFEISAQHRVRYETLSDQFRNGSAGSDQILSLRTLAQAVLHLDDRLKLKLELQDARAEFVDAGSRMNAAIVNAAELLQANLEWKTSNLFQDGSESILRVGRFTIDLGKRRFVARNRFRNVIQAFSGLNWNWKAREGVHVQTLLTLPVNRQPTAVPPLLSNDAAFDEESFHQVFWGVFVSAPNLPAEHSAEISFFALHEDDGNQYLTRNRELYTPGFRVYRAARRGRWDYEIETMFQFGIVRATALAADTTDLDQFAHFHHAEVGYTFDSNWCWRLFAEYDYASGDGDPTDTSSGRFEPLFGPNVSEFGPTSIYTAFVRSNINSPGVRLQVRPHKKVSAYLSYRAFWLASGTDVWQGASRLRDTSGNSGNFLGHQLFLRSKWKVHPNLKLEGGVVYRIDGSFQDSVPRSPHQGNSIYSYLSTTLLF